MAEIKLEEIKSVAFELIKKDQENFNISDSHEKLLYSLAYYDGVLDLVDDIANNFFSDYKRI